MPRLADNFARYLKPDGTMARAFVSYKEIAAHCDTRLFSTTYPLIGQRFELGGKWSNLQVGEIQLQVFRLPPLPGIPQNQMPQSLDECVRGLRQMHWHKVTYFEGTLTQNGCDCTVCSSSQLRRTDANAVHSRGAAVSSESSVARWSRSTMSPNARLPPSTSRRPLQCRTTMMLGVAH